MWGGGRGGNYIVVGELIPMDCGRAPDSRWRIGDPRERVPGERVPGKAIIIRRSRAILGPERGMAMKDGLGLTCTSEKPGRPRATDV